MTDFSPDKQERPRKKLSEQQEELLRLVWEFGGDPIKAAKAAGYSNPYAAVEVLSEELREMAERYIARLSLKSVMKVEEVLDSEGKIPQASEKLKAAQLILDRTHPRTEKVDLEAKVKGSIFILPDKKPLNEPEEIQD